MTVYIDMNFKRLGIYLTDGLPNWSFGDGETASGKEAQHTFTQGVYVVVVRVEDEDGQKATSQITISAEEECAC